MIETAVDKLILLQEQYPEIIAFVLSIAVLVLYRYKFKGEWPAVFRLRKAVLPILSYALPKSWKKRGIELTRKQYEQEFVGNYRISKSELKKKFRDTPEIYPNNIAKLKYIERDGERKWEDGSWAHRERNIAGKYQTHIMVYDNMNGTVSIYAHFEFNALTYPIWHYFGGEAWDIDKGVQKAAVIMEEIMDEK